MIPEVAWKHDDAVEVARKQPGWREFHKACAVEKLFFDHIEKHGRQYLAIALVGSGAAMKVAEERAATPIAALAAAYRASSTRVPAAEPWLAMLENPGADEFGALMADEFEELL